MKMRGCVGVVFAVVFTLVAVPANAATIKVNTLEDGFDEDGKCALREAVEAANKNKSVDSCAKGESKRDVIELKAGTYQLSFISTNEDGNANGDLDFTGKGPVTVVGKGKGK